MACLKDRVRRGILVCGTLVTIIGLVGYGATAVAQEQQPQQPAQEQQDQAQAQEQPRFEQVVEVTGSLIPRPTLEAMSPVTTLDPEEITTAGTTRIEDLLTSLPQVFASQNSTLSNNSTGTATVDLRYLGSQRTLVLIDGRRMASGDIFDVAPDLNFIPSALVKRVDVLTGGASSVYGADAVAGVVNFIIDRDFEGLKAGIFGSGYQHNNNNALAQRINEEAGYTVPSGGAWDGGAFDAYMAYGAKFADGKAHASMYIDYRQTSALLKNRRDYTNCSVLGGLGEDGPSCGGSYTSPTGDFYTPDNNFDWTLDTTGPGNTFRPFELPNDLFNYGAVNFMQRPDVRWVAGGFFDYTWSEQLQGYMSVMFMDDVTDAQIAPSGDFFVTNYINCDNPMLSDDQRQKVCTDLGYGPNDLAERPGAAPDRPPQRRGRPPQQPPRARRVPSRRRPQGRPQRGLELRRLRAARPVARPCGVPERPQRQQPAGCADRRRRSRRPEHLGVPLRQRRLRTLEHLPGRRCHPGSAQLPHCPADLQLRDENRPDEREAQR